MLSLALAGSLAATATDSLQVSFTGDDHCLVRVDSDKKYLLLPIEEDVPDARINVLVNGELKQTFYARLATRKVDYYVPFDIDRFGKDAKIVLQVQTAPHPDRSGRTSTDIFATKMLLSNSFDTANTEKHRPLFHHTPLYGWMNDPNGMFYKDGVWHLYYQYNPYGSMWQNMTWGHSSSKDLLHWQHHPLAIEPNALGAVFSGSSVVDKDNTAGFGEDAIIALFTSASDAQTQSLAYSTDNGLNFTRFDGNPVIAYERESRDPNMFWDDANKQWVLLLASALDHEMLVFTSKDLKEWELQSKFGNGYGSQGGVWECPDLMELPVEGSNKKKWVLICNINPGFIFGGSGTQYFVGDFDGTKFVADSEPDVTKWLDYGKDFYATVSFSNAPDNRKTAIAWMSNWDYANQVPTKQFRSANTLPRELSVFRAPDGELYVASTPSPEVTAMRGVPVNYKPGNVSPSGLTYTLPADNDGICEIVVDADLRKDKTLDIILSNAEGEKVTMTLDAKNRTFSMDRTQSGLTEFSPAFPVVTTAPTHTAMGRQTIRIFVDRSSIEVFDAKGRFTMTNLVFPTNPYTTLTLSSPKGAKVPALSVYPLTPTMK